MNSATDLAKDAFNRAIKNIRNNAPILKPFINFDVDNKKDFNHLKRKIGKELAEDFVKVKYGKKRTVKVIG